MTCGRRTIAPIFALWPLWTSCGHDRVSDDDVGGEGEGEGEGEPCDCGDGLFCNGDEQCDPVAGCVPGPTPDCRDSVDCTDDSCDEERDVCVHEPRNVLCSDARACNGEEICSAERGCQPGVPSCDDLGDCAPFHCLDDQPGGAACLQTPDHGECSEGSICVTIKAGYEYACASVPCEVDADCDDHEACNGVESCGPDGCAPGVPMPCDNGIFCDGLEVCELGVCRHSIPPSCDDGVACTTDSCDPVMDECVHVPDDAVCDDGLACNGGESCTETGCDPGAPLCLDD